MKWLFPDDGDVPIDNTGRAAVGVEMFISGVLNPNAVVLHRGLMHFSPDGKHCCVRNNDNAHRICVTFSEC